jgi:hexosaminidase
MKDNKLMVNLDAEVPNLVIYYSIDDSMPGKYSLRYNQAIEIPEGPVTLRAITYRDGKPVGRMLILKREELKKRIPAK